MAAREGRSRVLRPQDKGPAFAVPGLKAERVEQVSRELIRAQSQRATGTYDFLEEQSEITTQVENLYAAAWGNRTKACDLLTGKHRTRDFTAEALLARGYKELAKPDANRDFAGLYNTVVTLTDMSRAVTQKEGMKERIKAFATKVQEEIP